MRGLLWLQEGFRLFSAQPGRWTVVLALWLWMTLLMPGLLLIGLEGVRRLITLALAPVGLAEPLSSLLDILPMLGPLAMVLIFPLILSGLMVGCAKVMQGERLHPRHLFAALSREPSRLITVGGFNAVGQILISWAIAWFVHDRLGDVDFSLPNGVDTTEKLGLILTRLSDAAPVMMPVVVLQTVLMACLWFTSPLLVFHAMSPLAAVSASVRACARNVGALTIYALAIVLMLSFVGAVLAAAGAGIAFALIGLGVLAAAMTTVITSLYVSYRDIFQPHG